MRNHWQIKLVIISGFYMRTVINKQQALEDFKQQMGLVSISADLVENPLPHLIIVEPETIIV